MLLSISSYVYFKKFVFCFSLKLWSFFFFSWGLEKHFRVPMLDIIWNSAASSPLTDLEINFQTSCGAGEASSLRFWKWQQYWLPTWRLLVSISTVLQKKILSVVNINVVLFYGKNLCIGGKKAICRTRNSLSFIRTSYEDRFHPPPSFFKGNTAAAKPSFAWKNNVQ